VDKKKAECNPPVTPAKKEEPLSESLENLDTEKAILASLTPLPVVTPPAKPAAPAPEPIKPTPAAKAVAVIQPTKVVAPQSIHNANLQRTYKCPTIADIFTYVISGSFTLASNLFNKACTLYTGKESTDHAKGM